MEEFIQLASASKSLSKGDVKRLFTVVNAFKDCHYMKAVRLLECRGNHPVLLQYSSDCTPAVHRRFFRTGVLSRKGVRNAETCSELLVQHMLLTTFSEEDVPEHLFLMKEALHLAQGKKMVALAACAIEWGCMKLAAHCVGKPRVRFQVYDRGVGRVLLDVVSGFWSMQCSSASHSADDGDDESDTFNLQVFGHCACHDAHSALKWSLIGFHNEGMISNVFMALRSYRFAQGHCLSVLPSWLESVIEGRDRADLPEQHTLSSLWAVLGLPPDVAEEVARMGLIWQEDRLCIASDELESAECLETISELLMSVWRVKSFSASRWLSSGSACRSMVVGLLTGLHSCVHALRAQHVVSDYYASNVEKLGLPEKRFVSVVAMSSWLSESFLEEMLQDARVATRCDELQELIACEYDALSKLPTNVYELIAVAGNYDASELRSAVLTAASISWCFLDQKVFRVAKQYPWSLVGMGEENAIEHLSGLDTLPANDFCKKLCLLLAAGVSPKTVGRCIRLLGECVWSTAATEKQHSGVSTVKRFHPSLSLSVLATRGFMHIQRQLLPGRTEERKQYEKWQLRRQRLEKQVPTRLTGRNVFFREVVAKATALEEGKRHKNKFNKKWVMNLHAKRWKTLPVEVKQRYEVAYK
eukprot:6390429-Amphidinium_carterae.6